MKKIFYVLILLFLAFGIYKLVFTGPGTTQNQVIPDSQADLILYWGVGCPHCEKVKKFITDNNIDSKLKISQKEVFYDKKNQADFQAVTQKCTNLSENEKAGVPLAYSNIDKTCISGDAPIIEYIQGKISNK